MVENAGQRIAERQGLELLTGLGQLEVKIAVVVPAVAAEHHAHHESRDNGPRGRMQTECHDCGARSDRERQRARDPRVAKSPARARE